MIFIGVVRRRSSVGDRPWVAGEAEVFRCNPQRRRRIMEETGWDTVFDGTLNVRVVDGSVAAGLRDMRALFIERPEDIRHPTSPRLPGIRGGYFYYRAMASRRGETQEVLVRRAGDLRDIRAVELVAPVKLMDRFQVDEGDRIIVEVR